MSPVQPVRNTAVGSPAGGAGHAPSTSGPRVGLLTSGSRGDVQPYLALAAGLKRAGVDITVITHEPFRQFVAEQGVPFRSLRGDPRALLSTEVGKQLLSLGDKSKQFFKKMVELAEPITVDVTEDAVKALQDMDVLLCTSSLMFVGEALAEKLKCQLIYVSLQPVAPTIEQQGVFQTPLPSWLKFLEGWGWHRVAQNVGIYAYGHFYRHTTRRIRKEVLGLPPRRQFDASYFNKNGPLFLYGYSQHVVPRPSDWAPTQQVCGYWFLDSDPNWQPPVALQEFLKAGPPPVYVGFGSMPSEDPVATRKLVVEALQKAGQRGIVMQGWGGMDAADLPESIFVVDSIPHDWLFPQMAAVVHHGGAGTTATGLRAGIPTVILSQIADQPYWGRRVHALGAGPAHIPRKQLTADNLAAAIDQAVNNPSIRAAAKRLGEQIRSEDGIATAVAILKQKLGIPQG